jgi:hypothetical protein
MDHQSVHLKDLFILHIVELEMVRISIKMLFEVVCLANSETLVVLLLILYCYFLVFKF